MPCLFWIGAAPPPKEGFQVELTLWEESAGPASPPKEGFQVGLTLWEASAGPASPPKDGFRVELTLWEESAVSERAFRAALTGSDWRLGLVGSGRGTGGLRNCAVRGMIRLDSSN